MNKLKVLITSSGGRAGINCINALRHQKEIPVEIIGVDADSEAAGLLFTDKYFHVPKVNDAGYLSTILDICNKEGVDVILPIYSGEISIFSSNIFEFQAKKIGIAISQKETVDLLDNKWLTYNFFLQNKIPTQTTIQPECGHPINILRYPFYAKPTHGSGGKGNFVIKSKSDFDHVANQINHPYIFQEFINGREFTVDSLADNTSNLITAVVRERIRTRNGQSVVAKTAHDERIIPIVKNIVSQLKIKGPFNVQYFQMPDNSILLNEINPRFASGGLALALKVGINIPLMTIKIALSMDVLPAFNYQNDIKMFSYYTQIFVDQNGMSF